uniref:Mitochondrial carrier protein n=1 Tax=Kalanchoe fedtschenkoi TaxID=63787 RepID=A0A7N0V4V9_KALFE
MGIGIDPLDPFLNSLDAVKGAFSSMDMSIRKAVRDPKCREEGLNKLRCSLGSSSSASASESHCLKKVQICVAGENGESGAVDYVKKDVTISFGGPAKGGMQLLFMWSALLNTSGQIFASSIKMGNNRFQKEGDAASGDACLKSHLGASAAFFTYGKPNKKAKRGRIVEGFSDEVVVRKGEKNVLLGLLAGFPFDQIFHSLQKIHHSMIANYKDVLDGHLSFVSISSKASKETRFFQNLRFARLGSVPSNMVEVTFPHGEKNFEGAATRNEENTEARSSQRLPEDVQNSPDYSRSTSSSVSFSELTELVPKLERPSQNHPDLKERLPQQDSFRYTKSEASSVKVAAPTKEHTENVLKSALAGGFSCALSSFIMHPVDTVKTQVQASTLSLPEIISKLPEIGYRGLYRGTIPAVLGQFSSHGLRTGICETIKFILINVAPAMPDFQVLKQRLQAGLYENLGEAIVGTWKQDGLKAFFRGTGATLCREIPFYVAGMGLYTESKKAVQRVIGRQLEPWEIVIVGAISGGLAAVSTTPFDVIKTRMMIATAGSPVSMSAIALSILQQEGPLGLFKGALPRFFWVAPLGAMNFAGYELARKALG